MKNTLFLALVSFLLLSCKQEKKGIEQFSWLSGKWIGNVNGSDFYEEWEPICGNFMNGNGVEMNGKDMVFSEKIRIEQRGEDLFYIPTVAENGGAVDFIFTGLKNDSIVFENPTHDFPQRIIYFKQPNDHLYACIDGMNKGKYSRVEFLYSKVK